MIEAVTPYNNHDEYGVGNEFGGYSIPDINKSIIETKDLDINTISEKLYKIAQVKNGDYPSGLHFGPTTNGLFYHGEGDNIYTEIAELWVRCQEDPEMRKFLENGSIDLQDIIVNYTSIEKQQKAKGQTLNDQKKYTNTSISGRSLRKNNYGWLFPSRKKKEPEDADKIPKEAFYGDQKPKLNKKILAFLAAGALILGGIGAYFLNYHTDNKKIDKKENPSDDGNIPADDAQFYVKETAEQILDSTPDEISKLIKDLEYFNSQAMLNISYSPENDTKISDIINITIPWDYIDVLNTSDSKKAKTDNDTWGVGIVYKDGKVREVMKLEKWQVRELWKIQREELKTALHEIKEYEITGNDSYKIWNRIVQMDAFIFDEEVLNSEEDDTAQTNTLISGEGVRDKESVIA